MKSKKNIIIVLSVTILFVGATIAYFLFGKDFSNIFKTSSYGVTVSQHFDSPDGWAPGDTTPINFYVKNNGSAEVAVRVSCESYWIDESYDQYDNEVEGVQAAIINYANPLEWINDGNYYYYYKRLAKNEQSSTFVDSVTFNPNLENQYNCNSNELASDVCNSIAYPYVGSKYTLDCKFETIQFKNYKYSWNTSIEIE